MIHETGSLLYYLDGAFGDWEMFTSCTYNMMLGRKNYMIYTICVEFVVTEGVCDDNIFGDVRNTSVGELLDTDVGNPSGTSLWRYVFGRLDL